MDFISAQALLEKLLTHVIEQHPIPVAAGIYIITIMAIGTIALTVAIIYKGITLPWELIGKMFRRS